MYDNDFYDSESEAVHHELRKMKRTLWIGLVVCALVSGIIGFAAGHIAAADTKAPVIVESTDRTPVPDGVAPDPSINIPMVAEATQNSVVEIRTESVVNGFFLTQYVTEGAGSGVIISEDGYIVTNNHVIDGANTVKVTLHDGSTYDAEIIASDPKMDIGVIRIEAEGLQPAVMGDSDQISVGEPVVAVGNPLGQLGGTVTDGIVSALDREITLSNEKHNLMQTNAAINPGNSGGGLFNAKGELIGIVVAKSAGSDIEGLGFAIPVNDAKVVIQELINKGYVGGRVSLGVSVLDLSDPNLAAQYGYKAPGIYIQDIVEHSSADEAGLHAGDCFISINDIAIESLVDITSILNESSVGDTLSVRVKRNRQIIEIPVVLKEKKN